MRKKIIPPLDRHVLEEKTHHKGEKVVKQKKGSKHKYIFSKFHGIITVSTQMMEKHLDGSVVRYTCVFQLPFKIIHSFK